MPDIDLNLLISLDVLLAEASVTRAARRLGLSPSAMSRTLAKLRHLTGDPLLVRAGRSFVPTPHALALGDRVHALSIEAQTVLQPFNELFDLATLQRIFTLRAGEGFVELLAAPLAAHIEKVAPGVRLRFALKSDKDPQPLRDGNVDLEVGVLGTTAPEVRTRLLFHDRLVGVARANHPLLPAPLTASRFAAAGHVQASRTGAFSGPVDTALAAIGLSRTVSLVVPAYTDAMRIARQSDLLAVVPGSCLGNGLAGNHAHNLGLASFELPFTTPTFAIRIIWHPRFEADPAHRWLRETVVTVCKAAYP